MMARVYENQIKAALSHINNETFTNGKSQEDANWLESVGRELAHTLAQTAWFTGSPGRSSYKTFDILARKEKFVGDRDHLVGEMRLLEDPQTKEPKLVVSFGNVKASSPTVEKEWEPPSAVGSRQFDLKELQENPSTFTSFIEHELVALCEHRLTWLKKWSVHEKPKSWHV